MKTLFTLIILSFLSNCFANLEPSLETSALNVVGRIEIQNNTIRLIRSVEGDSIPSILQTPELKNELSKLNHGDEALFQGHITYLPATSETHVGPRPVFVIESIKPLSLKLLGQSEMKTDDLTIFRIPSKEIYSPMFIPVSTEVASTITLTTSLMLMQSLAASSTDAQLTQQINSGLILFAGALATGFFIYDHITGSQKKDNSND